MFLLTTPEILTVVGAGFLIVALLGIFLVGGGYMFITGIVDLLKGDNFLHSMIGVFFGLALLAVGLLLLASLFAL